MITDICEHKCCKATYCPLSLAFGRTIHTFQGQEARPQEKGKPPNAAEQLVCDPGTRSFEGNTPGLLYTTTSRGTTIQDAQAGNSAIYFFGENMTRKRIQNLCLDSKGKLYKRVALRKKWVKYLRRRINNTVYSDEEVEDILDWANEKRVSIDEVEGIIARGAWRN